MFNEIKNQIIPEWQISVKRFIDVTVSVIVLICFSWLYLLIGLVVRLGSKGPMFFKQERIGIHGKPFYIYKYRTMLVDAEKEGPALSSANDPRVTPFGRFLRKVRLDEMPQFYNVIMGDMSLVGPRPLLVEYLPLYSAEQARRHEVKPGITGWAQVNGRNAISWVQKFELDVWYVDNQSFWLDIKILFLTVWKVLRRKDISADGEVTMAPFLGRKKEI